MTEQLFKLKKQHKAMKTQHKSVKIQLKVMSAALRETKGLLALATRDYEGTPYNGG
jgi:hypothetical protein